MLRREATSPPNLPNISSINIEPTPLKIANLTTPRVLPPPLPTPNPPTCPRKRMATAAFESMSLCLLPLTTCMWDHLNSYVPCSLYDHFPTYERKEACLRTYVGWQRCTRFFPLSERLLSPRGCLTLVVFCLLQDASYESDGSHGLSMSPGNAAEEAGYSAELHVAHEPLKSSAKKTVKSLNHLLAFSFPARERPSASTYKRPQGLVHATFKRERFVQAKYVPLPTPSWSLSCLVFPLHLYHILTHLFADLRDRLRLKTGLHHRIAHYWQSCRLCCVASPQLPVYRLEKWRILRQHYRSRCSYRLGTRRVRGMSLQWKK